MAFFKGDDERDTGAKIGLVPLLPLRDIVVFPHMVVPLFVGREKSVRALEKAMAGDRTLLLAAQRDAKRSSSSAPSARSSSSSGFPTAP